MRYLFPLNPYNQQRQFQKPVWVYPCHLAAYATYLRNEGHEVVWDSGNFLLVKSGLGVNEVGKTAKFIMDSIVIENDFQIDVPFEKLPFPDREFTDAKNKRWQSYGNYKLHPATHMMTSNLCWWGKCTFCIDTAKLQAGEKRGVRSVDHVMQEIDDLIRLGFREVFDDSGTFPIGEWLEEFCEKMNERPKKGIHESLLWPHGNFTFVPKSHFSKSRELISVGCNMKPISEKVVPFKLMKRAGFRFMLVGVESANQNTIDKIRKGQESSKVIENMKAMNDAGLEVHLTSMFGYPWETHEDAMRTVNEIHYLLRKGYVKTAQASVYMPPRTAPPANADAQKYVQMVYDIYKDPRYWFRKALDLKRWEDFTYLLKRLPLVRHAE